MTTTCLKAVVGDKALWPPHVLRLWLGISKSTLTAETLAPKNPQSCGSLIVRRSWDCHKVDVNPVTFSY